MTLVELVYTSEAASHVTSDDIHQLVEKARIKNRRHGLSGLLIHSAPYFIQLIEGKAEAVIETFNRVQEDARHQNIHMLQLGLIDQRSFPEWDMGLIHAVGDWNLDNKQIDRILRRPSRQVSKGILAIEHFYQQASVVPV
ncbi:BLUF domain-containing protein [bacterium]|nr:BLUF domain-containing protein [bacterium]